MVKVIKNKKVHEYFLDRDRPFKNEANNWWYKGNTERFQAVYFNILQKKPINHLTSLNKKNPKIMILGAALGLDIIKLKEELLKNKVNPQIDVFSLTKIKNTIFPKELKQNKKEVLRTIENDYSTGVYFENIALNKSLAEKIKFKYDLVVAPSSVSVFTEHPEYNAFQSALLLNKGGKAYVEINVEHYLVPRSLGGGVNYNVTKHFPFMIKAVNRLIKSYNTKNKTNLEFKCDFVFYNKTSAPYFEIERLN